MQVTVKVAIMRPAEMSMLVNPSRNEFLNTS